MPVLWLLFCEAYTELVGDVGDRAEALEGALRRVAAGTGNRERDACEGGSTAAASELDDEVECCVITGGEAGERMGVGGLIVGVTVRGGMVL